MAKQIKSKDHHRIDSLIVLLSRFIYTQWITVTAEWGLTPPQNKILRLLEKDDNQSINKLSKAMICTQSNLTGIIDNMEKNGLVRRIRSRDDRRIIKIGLTEKSRRLLSSIAPWPEIYRQSMTPKLTLKEAKTLKDLLERLYSFYKQS